MIAYRKSVEAGSSGFIAPSDVPRGVAIDAAECAVRFAARRDVRVKQRITAGSRSTAILRSRD
jgi:hypothetical protein